MAMSYIVSHNWEVESRPTELDIGHHAGIVCYWLGRHQSICWRRLRSHTLWSTLRGKHLLVQRIKHPSECRVNPVNFTTRPKDKAFFGGFTPPAGVNPVTSISQPADDFVETRSKVERVKWEDAKIHSDLINPLNSSFLGGRAWYFGATNFNAN